MKRARIIIPVPAPTLRTVTNGRPNISILLMCGMLTYNTIDLIILKNNKLIKSGRIFAGDVSKHQKEKKII